MLPRLLRLHPRTYQRLVRLSKAAEREGAYRVAKRLRAVVLNSEGHTSGELANILPAPRSKVSEWLQRYQAEGVDGLLEGYRSGRPAELSEKQKQQLGDILDSGPVAYGLDTASGHRPGLPGSLNRSLACSTIPVMCASCCIPGDFRCSGHGVCWSAPMRRPRIAGIGVRILLSKKSTIPTLGVDLYG